jgi:glycerol-3-phosphate dehydrogenase
MLSRGERIKYYKENPEVSVLIIGAGINGIGAFWDLALQGVDVLLVDQVDYCSGASAASSHMVHGGIRYLENGEFRLVREAVQERNRLIENAPHLVEPLPTTFPIFKWFSGILNAPLKFLGVLDRPAERGAIVIKIGMTIYDFYTRRQGTVPKHVFMDRKESLQHFPALNPEVIFTGTYYDAAMPSPEQIAVELVLDAVQVNERAIPLNYVGLDSMQDDRVMLRDEITGERFGVIPKIVINAAGPWIDIVNRTLGKETLFIGGTKGSHLVLDHPELRKAIGEHEFFFENKDGRIVLIFPLQDRVIIGTSDIRIDNPDDVVITGEEIRYFFDMVGRVFPGIAVNHSHIVFTFSGVRPLEHSDSRSTGQISRDHKIEEIEIEGSRSFPVFSLVGGKWTTFRALAEQVSDRAIEKLDVRRRSTTRESAIGGGKDYPRNREGQERWIADLARKTGLPLERIRDLFSRYGTRAGEIATFISKGEDHALMNYSSYSSREIAYLLQHEDVIHLDDFIFRRSMIGMLGRITKEGLEELGNVMGSVKGWEEDEILDEIQRTIHILQLKHKMDFNRYMGN